MTAGDSRILAVSSSTAVVGVAASIGSEVIGFEQVVTDRRHAEELTPMVASMLADVGWKAVDVDRFAVDVGPGRFTGLRVGLATVRALAFAVGSPIVGVTSLEILAADHGGPVAAVIDARRNEVFQQRFVDGIAVEEAVVGSADWAASLVGAGDVVVGDGADRYPDAYAGFTVVAGRDPSAATLARLASARSGRPGPDVEPVYLRQADVQINIKTRHNS